MRLDNYADLGRHPVQLSLCVNRSESFRDVFHAHQGIEILYVHRGSGRVMIGQDLFEMKPGTLLFFKPFQLHTIRMTITEVQPYIRSMLLFDPAVLLRYTEPYPTLNSFLLHIWKHPLNHQWVDVPDPEAMDALFHFYKGDTTVSGNSPLQSEKIVLDTISLLHRIQVLFEKGSAAGRIGTTLRFSPSVAAILDWIEVNYASEFRLTDLAGHVHLTPNHVSYLFHRETGSTLTSYLTARRLQQASFLLKTTNLSVREIGHRIGFSNFSYFCQLFKKHNGLSPAKYRAS
ncbi:AraC family transcriptional regulator [Paenibacillus sp. UNC499MF]|uniref:AraC family transcriptional regulator n=1 Tax=Paenibacillus sp. UNC499MF TaxID=1502751 RepID=UPI0008A05C39|nr:AraC family transcriptional regulator [Paenibacillus sp. UNC499MF]SEG18177.1 AraC-like ligand binding domain-containing protein [Paenibacillus sp. UNC499MF]